MMGLLAYDKVKQFGELQLELSLLASLFSEPTRASQSLALLEGGLELKRSASASIVLHREDFEDESIFDLCCLILVLPWEPVEFCTTPQDSAEFLIRAFFETRHRMSHLLSMLDNLQAMPSFLRFYVEEIAVRAKARKSRQVEKFGEGLDGLLGTRS